MSLLSEEVIWCYRNLLGREPVLDEIVQVQQKIVDFKQLVMDCVHLPEFAVRLKHGTPNHEVNFSIASVLNRLNIEVSATEEELSKCASKIKQTWEHLGTEKAHWSVLSVDTFLPDSLHQSIDSFWALGLAEAAQAAQVLSGFGYGQFEQKVCVEFGCGVGRLTIGLAETYKVVHAYDISRTHLAYAKARASEVGASNIEFHECSSDFRLPIEPCDFFYSVIVLQHNPPPVILALIRAALKALKPGGIAMFQVPTYIVGYSFNLLNWLATDQTLLMEMHCVPQDAVMEIISVSGCRLLSVREDGCSNPMVGMVSNTFVCVKQI
jgi:2-polyprenyl-3-methyl-5-hydroxy-6-metoxy-1,4-benzoquinol methylase